MRTLRQIENAILDASKQRAAELLPTATGELMTENEIIAVQSQIRYGELFCQMHKVLTDVEFYLAGDSDPSEEKKVLLERIKDI